MANEKFTPAPWFAHKDRDDTWDICSRDDTVCSLSYLREEDHVSIEYENDQANAHLIAAAPELYEALKDMVDASSRHYTFTKGGNTAIRDIAEQALAKARGEVVQ